MCCKDNSGGECIVISTVSRLVAGTWMGSCSVLESLLGLRLGLRSALAEG